MKLHKVYILKIFGIFFLFGNLNPFAYAPINFTKPHDPNFRMTSWPIKGKNKREIVKIGNTLEFGSTKKSRNYNRDSVNLLSLYQDKQSSLAMLLQAQPGSAIYNLKNSIEDAYTTPNTDNNRGSFKVNGKFEGIDYSLYSQFNFDFESIPGKFDFTAYLPVRSLKIKDVQWIDQTKSYNAADLEVKRVLTNDIATVVKNLGDLDIGSWSKTGFGDLELILRWYNDFPKYKSTLKNVRLGFRTGLILPTSPEIDVNKSFSMPLGNDGAFAFPIAASLDLSFKYKFRFGVDLEMIKVFDITKVYRLKSDSNQTDFLLLNKGMVRRSFGNQWTFNMYAGAEHFFHGLSAKLNYQYGTNGEDTLQVHDLNFNQDIANTAQSFMEWNYHNLIFNLSYDFYKDFPNAKIKPQLSLFYKYPLIGRRTIMASTFGGVLAFNF
ncbi:TPA: hypothetical protein DEO28_04245 [Candidatus Dependentiae bacterium]|nr:MAG: hypothetical protein UR14_C0006G0085 [candidate division TM6 bacterium GW2011_GWE2_31_21]KKP53492.1 MAG: hypothetical protein UR43_C0004G0033 [candidate division TM6 bacterium GW2011_GWF2_33_332]HBS48267.1 hypothetical protein [Candidatus Dependentiae bacterium]HBZ73694.1 hypothetical protein [Candidatus Dependentiae bacterium]